MLRLAAEQALYDSSQPDEDSARALIHAISLVGCFLLHCSDGLACFVTSALPAASL